MDNNDSNLKSQSTGGLKLMTVFIAVLALHVVVIGGLTAYHLMSGGSADADLVTDKSHKDIKISPDGSVAIDGQLTDGSQTDKSAVASTTPTDASTSPAPATAQAAPAPASDPTTTTEVSSTPSAPATPTEVSSSPSTSTTSTEVSNAPGAPTTTTVVSSTSTAPATVTEVSGPSTIASAPESAPTPVASTPSGPVITPSTATTPTSALATEPVTTQSPQPDSVIGTTYIVKMNDTLERIAHRHHTTMAKLKAANGLDGDLLHLGQKLLIPTRGVVASSLTSAPTADTTGTTTLLESSSPAPVTPLATHTSSRTSSHHTYTVVKGDTLIRIAHRFKTTAKALMITNNITDPTKLSIGKKLVIPSREARSAATSTPANAQPAQVKAGSTAQLVNYTR